MPKGAVSAPFCFAVMAVENCARQPKKVAGRKRWYEEATHTAPEPAEPHGTQEMRRT